MRGKPSQPRRNPHAERSRAQSQGNAASGISHHGHRLPGTKQSYALRTERGECGETAAEARSEQQFCPTAAQCAARRQPTEKSKDKASSHIHRKRGPRKALPHMLLQYPRHQIARRRADGTAECHNQNVVHTGHKVTLFPSHCTPLQSQCSNMPPTYHKKRK